MTSHPLRNTIMVLVLCLLMLGAIFWLIKAPLTSHYVSQKMKVDTSIGSVTISSNSLTFRNFVINNPEKFKDVVAFSGKSISVQYTGGFSGLFEPHLTIDQIYVNSGMIQVNCLEPSCSSNNWTVILQNMKTREKPMKEIQIKKLILHDLTIHVTGSGLSIGGTKDLYIDHLELENLSSREGFPTQEVIAYIFQTAGLSEYLQGFIQEVIPSPKGFLQNLFGKTKSFFQSLFGSAKEEKTSMS